ncbi:MAG TPA: hypothetical protein VII51_01110 [Gaiellaceae bacterium]
MKRILAWVVPAAAAAAVAPVVRGNGGDAWLFVLGGRTLLSAHWSHAFADPAMQAGPFQLALFGSVGRSPVALAVVLGAIAALLVVAAARAAGVERPALLAGVGVVAVAAGLTRAGFDSGHPADTLLPLLWIVAAAEARRGRTLRAGAIVGLGAGIETWSLLGLAVLVLAPRLRDAARGTAVAAAVAAALFLPFVAAGHFGLGRYHWVVSSQSLVSLVVAPGTAVGWQLRLAQTAFAIAVGIGVARATRGSRHALWLIPVCVVLARLLLDPLDSLYYFVGVEGPALVGLTLVAAYGLPFVASRRLAGEPLA